MFRKLIKTIHFLHVLLSDVWHSGISDKRWWRVFGYGTNPGVNCESTLKCVKIQRETPELLCFSKEPKEQPQHLRPTGCIAMMHPEFPEKLLQTAILQPLLKPRPRPTKREIIQLSIPLIIHLQTRDIKFNMFKCTTCPLRWLISVRFSSCCNVFGEFKEPQISNSWPKKSMGVPPLSTWI